MDKDDFWVLLILVIIAVMVAGVGVPVTRGIFVDKIKAINALEKQGFTDIKITDKSWFLVGFQGCGGRDAAKFTATAKNPRNQTIGKVVCVNFSDGTMIRNN